jgi:hypothetical protein
MAVTAHDIEIASLWEQVDWLEERVGRLEALSKGPVEQDKACELCGERSDMQFTAVLPMLDHHTVTVEGDICLKCYGEYADDFAVIEALFEKWGREVSSGAERVVAD